MVTCELVYPDNDTFGQVLLGLLSVWNVSFFGYPARVSSHVLYIVILNCLLYHTLVSRCNTSSLTNESPYLSLGHTPILSGTREVCPTYPTGIFILMYLCIYVCMSEYNTTAHILVNYGFFFLFVSEFALK